MQFYRLYWVVGVPYETVSCDMPPVHIGEAQECPMCGRGVGSLPWLPPYRAEIKAHTGKFGDIAYATGKSLLVSERFRRLWEEAGLRGITEFTPLERIRVRPARLSKKPVTYYHLEVKMWGTQVDVARSRIDREKPIECEKCKYGGLIDSIRGFSIDKSSWTGEDIFRPWGLSGDMIVTDRVRQLRDEHGLTNVNLTPVEQVWWDPLGRWEVLDRSP